MSVSFVNISCIVKDILAIAEKVKNNEIVEKSNRFTITAVNCSRRQ